MNNNRAEFLIKSKNHHYFENWRNMQVSSFIVLILMKLAGVRQVPDNDGHILVSTVMGANLFCIIHNAIFTLFNPEGYNENT